MALITQDAAMMDLIRSRLTNDERPLKRVLKAFYKLAEPDASSSLSPNDEDASEDFSDRLQRYHHEFLIELHSLARTLETTKGSRITQSTAKEVEGLQREKDKLQGQAEEQRRRIEVLERELEDAKKERRQKMEYEEVGREVRRFGDRIQSAERMAGLSREIDALLAEQESYSQRWASRQAQFDTVVGNLLLLQQSISEEKEEADRKKALDDDPDDAAGSDNDNEANTTAQGTPRPEGSSLDPSAPVFRPGARSGSTPGSPLARERSSLPMARGQSSDADREVDDAVMAGMAASGEEGARTSARTKEVVVDEDTAMEDGEEREEGEERQAMDQD